MLFKRREKQDRWGRFKLWLWPRVSWRRSMSYYVKRVLRLSGTPYAIAMGAAAGIGVAFTPFVGLHVVLACAIAWSFGGNLIASAIGTAVGNPVTYPFIWASTYEIGHFLLQGTSPDAPGAWGRVIDAPIEQILPLIKPMLLGSIPLGIAAGCVGFFIIYQAVVGYQAARRKRLAVRAEA
jgi:uncharacterized protein